MAAGQLIPSLVTPTGLCWPLAGNPTGGASEHKALRVGGIGPDLCLRGHLRADAARPRFPKRLRTRERRRRRAMLWVVAADTAEADLHVRSAGAGQFNGVAQCTRGSGALRGACGVASGPPAAGSPPSRRCPPWISPDRGSGRTRSVQVRELLRDALGRGNPRIPFRAQRESRRNGPPAAPTDSCRTDRRFLVAARRDLCSRGMAFIPEIGHPGSGSLAAGLAAASSRDSRHPQVPPVITGQES